MSLVTGMPIVQNILTSSKYDFTSYFTEVWLIISMIALTYGERTYVDFVS